VLIKPFVAEEFASQWIGRNQRVDGIINSLQSFQTASYELFDGW
jgi:hypothetical protein